MMNDAARSEMVNVCQQIQIVDQQLELGNSRNLITDQAGTGLACT